MTKIEIEHKLKLLFLDSFRHIIPYCPDNIISFIANCSALVTLKFGSEKGRIMREELKKVLGRDVPDKKINRIIKKGISNFRKDIFETWMFPTLTQNKIREMAYFVGRENLDEALSKGRGAIILITHFGLRKIILPALGYEGYKVNQVAANPTSWKANGKHKAAHNKILDIELTCENALPVNFIYIEKSLRNIFRVLSDNEILAIALDGPIGHKRINVKFLNCSANFSPTPMSLSLKTGASLLPTFAVRQKDNRHKIIIEEPLSIQTDKRWEFAVSKSMNTFSDILGKYVLKHPCHYVDWLYRAQLMPISENVFIFQSQGLDR